MRIGLTLALVLLARSGEAQGWQPIVGFGIGLAFPVNADQVRVGYSQSGFVGFYAPGILGARFEGGYNHFGVVGRDQIDAWSGTANLVVRVPVKPLEPYFITGLGYYTGPYVGSSGKFGTNLGAGARLPLANVVLFSELRVHHIFAAGGLHPGWYVPATFGVQVPFSLPW